MKVRAFPSNPGPSGWQAILPPRTPMAALDGDKACDVLIIGAGFAGLSAAQALHDKQPGLAVIVLEAGRIGDGPAGRNSGFMIDLPHDLASDDYGGGSAFDGPDVAGNRAAIDFAAQMQARYEMPAEALRKSGKVNGAASAKGHAHNLSYAAQLDAVGQSYELLDAAAMRAMTGTDFYRSGLFTPGTAVIQPALYIQALGDGLARVGVTIFENSAVLELQRGPDWMARTEHGSVRAGKVVLAVNGHAQSFGQFERQLMQVYTYGSMTRAMRADEVERLGGQPDWGVTPSDPMGSTIRRISGIGGHRIVVRNRFTYDPSMQVSGAQLARIVHDHRRAFEARFPMLSDVGFEHSWGGHLCLSRNSVPAFGEVEPGLIAACCQNGLGTTKGTLAGLLASEMVLGETSDLLVHQLSRAAPARLPPAPFFTPAARVYLRHIERRAGAEL